MKPYLFAGLLLITAGAPVLRPANPSYSPNWLVGDSFKVRFQFSQTRDVGEATPSAAIATNVTYTYTVTQLLIESGRPVAKILAFPDQDGWPQWLLTMDTSAVTFTSVEEVETSSKYLNPFGADAWMAKLEQYQGTIIHDFPRIPDSSANQSRTLSGGQSSTPGFTQTITFGPSAVTAVLSRNDPPTSLLHQSTIVWQAGAKWWSSAVMKLGSDVIVSGNLLSVARNCATIAPTTAPAPAGGGNGSIRVTAPAGCAWTARSNADWITISPGASGNGAGTVNYSVGANTGTFRTGTLTVAGQLVTIEQQPAPPTPLTAVLAAPAPPMVGRSAVTTVGGLEITVSGGIAGRRTTVNVQVFLNAPLAAVSDTAQLTDPTGTSIAGIKTTGNSYAFLNASILEPGPGASQVYRITNMKVNTSSGASPILAVVAISGSPLPLSNPMTIVAFLQ
jgi:hypothetical protein